MSKKFVDGSKAEPPYFAVLGSGYDTYITDYAMWKFLETAKTASSNQILGYEGKVWRLPDHASVARVVRRLSAKGSFVTHEELAAFPPQTATVCHVGETTLVTIPGTPSVQTKRMIEFLGLEGIRTNNGLVIDWPDVSDADLGGTALESLALVPPPSLTLQLRRRGWIISGELQCDGDTPQSVAKLIAERADVLGSITVAELPDVLGRATALGAVIDADFDPANPAAIESLDVSDAPGWLRPTTGGRKFFDFQRAGIEFVASRGGRALIADDMGLGKTAQGLGFAAGCGADRIVVVSPTAVRDVWVREIVAWDVAAKPQIHLIEPGTSAEQIPAEAKVVLTTYDLIAGRALTWREQDDAAFFELQRWLDPHTVGDDPAASVDTKKRSITLCRPIANAADAPITSERFPNWMDLHRRLANPRLSSLESWRPDLTIFDEAHHCKTPKAKRALASVQLSEASRFVLCLTGTPVQNRPEEGAQLVNLVHPRQYRILRDARISIERCREMLGPISIRRKKEDVLLDLPPLFEQLIELSGPMIIPEPATHERQWNDPLEDVPEWAAGLSPELAEFARWIPPNLSSIESMRVALGVAKAQRVDVLELLADMVSSGPLIVFAAHHDAIDSLTHGLRGNTSARIVSVDGRTPAHMRSKVVEKFQGGEFDCVVAGIDALGEGVTLTRATRVAFLETAWKPKTYQQARDRVRRIGQKSSVHAIYLLAPHALDHCLHAMATHKAALVSAVHDERIDVLGAQISGIVEDGELVVAKKAAEIGDAVAIDVSGGASRDESTLSNGARRMRAYRERHGAAVRERHRSYMREWRQRSARPSG